MISSLALNKFLIQIRMSEWYQSIPVRYPLEGRVFQNGQKPVIKKRAEIKNPNPSQITPPLYVLLTIHPGIFSCVNKGEKSSMGAFSLDIP